MPYAALASLVNVLDRILDHQSCICIRTKVQHCIFLLNKQRIRRLHGNIIFFMNFLCDFAREAQNLQQRLTDAAIQANDLFHIVEPRRDHQLFVGELERLIAETDLIREDAMQIKRNTKNAMPSRVRGNGNGTVVGMEEDLLEIKSRLYGGSSELGIIPIVGMGGIGKTTLARFAYDDPLCVHHFDLRVSITISQTYHLKGILLSILHLIKNVSSNVDKMLLSEDEDGYELLKENVYRYLKGRRYLIVMDDMWDMNLWDELRRMFPNDVNGSRIIITTRDLNLASYMDSLSQPHEMSLMSVEHSWILLKERVFGEESCPRELEKIGQVIAEKCRGLPLAIVVIAGVLSYKVNRLKDSWEKIANNVSEVISTNDEQFLEILSLSYTYLPSHLRPCFLYMGCFPEDYEIPVSKLIRLWAAEDFLTTNESKDVEELGYKYLEDLATRSLVLINKKGSDGKIRTVKMHDLLRDLCLRKSRKDNFLSTINEFSGEFSQGIENSNRLSVFCNISGCIPNMESSPIHTMLLFKHWAFDSWRSLRLLKVLDIELSVTSIKSSSSVMYIGELIHLRYLALSSEPVSTTLNLVSENLYRLQNLRILVFRISGSQKESVRFRPTKRSRMTNLDVYQQFLKLEIWRMPQLRHIIVLDCYLPHPSAEISLQISPMENLLTLSRMKDLKCSERFLRMIPNLKKLKVIYSYASTYETGWSQYGLNNLVHLHRLEILSLYSEPYPNLKDDLSPNISFPLSLKKLSLSGCRLPWEDMTMIGLLPNLQVLKLKRHACCGTEWETSEGEFCELKVLLIDSTDLVQWRSESTHFPKLERLTLYECDELREIPYDIGEIATLDLIEVDIRNPAMVESAKCIEVEQQSLGNDLLQVRFLKSRCWSNFTGF